MQRDEQIFDLILDEQDRQIHGIELIASENFVSDQVMEAAGSCLTNKYAEGYPGKRYYGGCEVVDVVEQIAIDRAKALFGAEYVNVQPHSGSQANTAVFAACLKPGDKILGFDLSIPAQIGVFITAILAGMGATGIPEGGLITMVMVLRNVNVPASAIGLLLPFDRILDRFRTVTNVWGDLVCAAVVDKLQHHHEQAK